MKWKATFALLPLTAVTVACAQSSVVPPLPEATILVQQAILQQRFAESKEQDYVFREDFGSNKLNKDCTWAPKCPAPFGAPGVKGVTYTVVGGESRHFEVFWLNGIRVARVLPPCGNPAGRKLPACDWHGLTNSTQNIPISDSELAAENQRVENEVAEARALLAQGKVAGSPDDPPQILLSRMLELSTFSDPRRQIVEGRPTILLDFAWNPTSEPASANEALLRSFSGTVGIDEEDHTVQHVEGRFLADVNSSEGRINIRKGTRVTLTNVRVDNGIWLLSSVVAWGEARYLAFTMDGEVFIHAGNYRKFRATSRILPSSTEVPADSPPPTAPKPPPNALH
jgi:hypothetical protein